MDYYTATFVGLEKAEQCYDDIIYIYWTLNQYLTFSIMIYVLYFFTKKMYVCLTSPFGAYGYDKLQGIIMYNFLLLHMVVQQHISLGAYLHFATCIPWTESYHHAKAYKEEMKVNKSFGVWKHIITIHPFLYIYI